MLKSLDILNKIHDEHPWVYLDRKTHDNKTYRYYQTCTDPSLLQAYIVAAVEMDGENATGKYQASNMPPVIPEIQKEIIKRLFANFYGAVVQCTEDHDLMKAGYFLFINSKAYQHANDGAWTDSEDVEFHNQHLIETLDKYYHVECDTPSENAIFYFKKMTPETNELISYTTFHEDLLQGMVDNDPNDSCTAAPWPHPMLKTSENTVGHDEPLLDNTERIKKFLNNYLKDASIPENCKDGKDWKRLSKYKIGNNMAREFSCKKQDNLLINVVTNPDNKLIEVVASWDILKAGLKP